MIFWLYYNRSIVIKKCNMFDRRLTEKMMRWINLFDRLQAVEDRYERLNELLSDPEIINDTKKLREYSKEQSDIQETVMTYQ